MHDYELAVFSAVAPNFALAELRRGRQLLNVTHQGMDDKKTIAKLTSGETAFLLVFCLVTGAAFGFALFYIHSGRWLWVPLFAVFGPGLWYQALCGFGVRGRERRAFIRGGSFWFTMLAFFAGVFVFFILYAWHCLYPTA